MTIEYTFQTKTVNQLLDMRDQLNFSLAIQRSEDLWSQEQKSLLIHSILYGYPIPAVWAVEKDNTLWNFVDGKQRLQSAIFGFVLGKYELKLDEENAEIENENIDELFFNELPEKLQKRLLNASVTINFLKNITEEEIENFFSRLNSGLTMTQIELTRVLASSKIMSFVQEIAKNKFFSETIALTENNRKRFVDEELILQIIALVINPDPVGLSGVEMREFAKQLRRNGISDKYQELIRQTTEYLNQAIPDKNKDLRKVHIPMIFKMAIQAQENDISPQKFGGWVQMFFAPKRYKASIYKNEYASKKTADKANVIGRLNEMQKFFDEYIESAPNYKKPEPGQRGRKPKKQTEVAK